MIPKPTRALISGALVGAMLFVAGAEIQHGEQAHLIPAAQLTTGSTANNAVTYHESTIIDVTYREPADSTPLPHDGVTQRST
jgi:hypothetical protein